MAFITKKEQAGNGRQSNFELLRIVCIFLIIAFHYSVHGNQSAIFSSAISANQVVSIALGSWGLLGVNGFLFISAYFLIGEESRFSTLKLLKLLLQTVFYSLGFVIVLALTGVITVDQQTIVGAVLSPFTGQYWFVTAFCVLYLVHPFLNRIIFGLSTRDLGKLVLVLLGLTVGYKTIYVLAPFGDFDFVVSLYLLMGYLKRTPQNWFERHAVKGFWLTTGGIVLFGILVSVFHDSLSFLNHGQMDRLRFISRYSPLMVLDAVFLFYLFKHFELKENRLINHLSRAGLGVYLFHENPILRLFLWDGWLNIDEAYQAPVLVYLFHFCISVLLLFGAGILVEWIRIRYFEKPLFKQLSTRFADSLSRLDGWMNGCIRAKEDTT